jgi:hypothetical protein
LSTLPSLHQPAAEGIRMTGAGAQRREGGIRGGWAVACAAVGSVLLSAGILAGLVNRNVLDGDRFARHADAMRRDPVVSRQIAAAITDRLLTVAPDLVAVRPLLDAATTSLVGSAAFGPIVRTSVRTVHGVFTGHQSGSVTLRLVDVGSALAGVLPAIAPRAAARLPADLTVTLEQVTNSSLVARTMRVTRLVGVLAWLLPLLGGMCFALGIWLARDRHRAVVRTGWAVAAAGAIVGVLAVAGSLISSMADTQTLRGALVRGAWHELGGLLWWTAGLTAAAGILIVAAATARIPEVDLAVEAKRAWSAITRRPVRRRTRIGRGVALAVVGLAAVLRPQLIVILLAVVAGLVLVVAGVGEIASAAGARRRPDRPARRARSWTPAAALGAAVVLVVALIAVDAAPADRQVSAVATGPMTCNGHRELCSRRYNEVAFPATHNAMSAADESGWFIPEQPTGLIGQLDAGIRVLLIDTYYGQNTEQPNIVATAPVSHAQALADAERLYGANVVASALRLHDALIPTRIGPVRPFLCHGLCELGATPWESLMEQVRAWLDAHPHEVVTFFIQDAVSPAATAALFEQAGLMPYVHTQQPGQAWPTLAEMINSGRRVIVLMEDHGGGSTYPWLLQGFDWVQDTPFSNPSPAALSCELNRGSPSNPLFLVNYWLNRYQSLVSDARTINAYQQFWPYVSRCRQQREHIPNYVAVNYYDQGDLFRVVDQLNGVG